MPDSTELLRRIARAVETRTVGLVDKAPGRTVLFANVVKAPDGCLWYSWNPNEQAPIPVERRNVRGRLVDLYCYEKASSKGTTIKVRASLDCGLTTYDIETSLYNSDRGTLVTSGKMLVAGLLAAPEAIHGGRMVTIGARPAEDPEARDQVLFLDVYTDDGQVRYDRAPDTKDQALGAVGDVRDYLGKSADPFDNPISNRAEPHEAGGAPNGGAQSGGGRPRHPSEEVYDPSPDPNGSGAPPQQAPPRGQKVGSEGSAANPSGVKQVSGTQSRFASKPLLEEPIPMDVRCPNCGADKGVNCEGENVSFEDEDLPEHHKERHVMAEGLAGDAGQFLTILVPYLDRASEQGDQAALADMIHDIGGATGRFPEDQWAKVVSTVGPYHEDATDILEQYREPQNQ
jgi:hypothetical protein